MENFFNTNLKFLREKKKLSQNKLANMIGVNQTTIARWESKEMAPSIDNVVDLTEILGVELAEMLGIDLRLQQPLNTTTFKKDGVEVTIAHDSNLDDKTLLEVNNFLLKEKILKDELKKEDKK